MRILGPRKFWMDAAPLVEPLRLRRAPLLTAAICFATGDVFARHWHVPFSLLLATASLLALAVVSLVKVRRMAAVPVLGLWVAVGCWCAQMQPSVPQQKELAQYADGLSRTVRGDVVRVRRLRAPINNDSEAPSAAEPWRADPGAWEAEKGAATVSIDLQVREVEEVTPDVSAMREVTGGVRVTVIGELSSPACGETLEAPLRLRQPEVYRDPGAWSNADALLREGISLHATAKAADLHRTGRGQATWKCRFFGAQNWAAGRIDSLVAESSLYKLPKLLRLQPDDAVMLQAMLLGDRDLLTHSMRVGFERTGTFHLFVVSGLHVAIIAGGLFWLFRRMRFPEPVAVAGSLTATTLYALFTGFGVPVQRALTMSAVYLLARALGRDRSALNALGAAALAVLLLDPRALFESSFQMTTLVIVAIAGVAAPLAERAFARWRGAEHELWTVRLDAALPPRTADLRVRLRMFGTAYSGVLGPWAGNAPLYALRALHWLLEAMLFGAVVEICMMLPMAVYFHRATLLSLPLNMVCVPLVAVLLCAAIATFCAALLSTKLALLPAAATAVLLHAVRAVVGRLGSVTLADFRVPMPSPLALVLAIAALAFACWALRSERRRWMAAGCFAVALVPVLMLWPPHPLLHPGVLEVTALDVGQGDSLLVVSPEGKTLLVDAGGPVGQASLDQAEDRWDVGEEVVAPYLWSRRIRRLDAVLLTHAHSDHMGGMPAILRDFRPRELWVSVQPLQAPSLVALLKEANELGVEVRWMRAGAAFPWSGLQAAVLSPDESYENTKGAANDDSLVVRLGFGQASVLLEGDAEGKSEAAMLRRQGTSLQSTLLKVGHHGSRTSTHREFLAVVAPREAVISVGRRNTFGHPRFEVLQELEAAGVKTYRTDRAGAETFLLRSDGGISAAPAASN